MTESNGQARKEAAQQAVDRPEPKGGPNVDASLAATGYANFCRVTGTPEEVLLDFGLNSEPFREPSGPIQISHRIVVNYYTAKRMLAALQMTVSRHEQTFGGLEVDVRKRVTAPAASETPADSR